MKLILPLILILSFSVLAQTEILTNSDVAEMTRAGLSKEVITQKIKTTGSNFEVTAKALIELKNAGVADEVIALILEKAKVQPEKSSLSAPPTGNISPENQKKVLSPAEILRSARTLALLKDSLNPSRQALEKELLKRPEWKKINLSITEDKASADLTAEIGFVPLSILTHRYVFRIYDRRSGLLIAAGETTSWGSLAENLARAMAKKLDAVLSK